MFWGLIMEPNKRYTQVVQRSFHISMAALDCTAEQNDNVQVLVGVNEKNFLLCNLNTKNQLQAQLDLNYQSGDKIAFMHTGTGYVHLTGYLVPEDDFDEMMDEAEEEVPELVKPNKKALKRKSSDNEEIKTKKKKLPTADLLEAYANESDDNDESFVVEDMNEESDDSDDDDESEDDDDNQNEEAEDEDEESDDDDDEDEDEESSEDGSEESEDEEAEETVVEKKPSKKNKKQKVQNGTVSPKKDKKQVDNSPKKDTEESSKSKKAEKQKQDKSKKKEGKNNKEGKQNNDKEIKPQKKTIEGGVHIEDLKVGSGPIAKPGKFVQVYYEGRLKSTGKQFDATKTGPGFKFRIGKKEVIQGWDVGVAGMRVGGKRRITCPPQMAYGAKGSPPVIPPNSTLVFDVELRNVN